MTAGPGGGGRGLPRHHRVLMVGTDPAGRGGIASVVSAYREAGLFDRFVIDYVVTHAEGTRWHKLRTAARAGWAVLRALAARDVAVLHAHVASSASFARKSVILALARGLGVRTVFHLHGGGFHHFYRDASAATQWWIRRTLERSSLVICLSESWQRTLEGLAPRARLAVLRNAVRVPPANLTEPDGQRLLFLGQIGAQKGVFVLADALGRLRAQGLALTLAVGGVGDAAALQRSADEHGVGAQLQLLGWIDAERRAQELARAGIFVLPSFNEGLPIALLEAMAAGLAVVTTPVGGIPELVTDGEEGLLVPPGDAPALARALGRLAGDALLRRRLGQAGRQKVLQHFSVNVAVDWLSQRYIALGALRREAGA